MKILQINNVYDYGSTGKITKDIHTGLLEKGCESVVIYGRRQKTSCGNVYKLCPEWYSKLNNLISRFTGMMYGGCHLSTRRIINRIRREKPDIVHLQCLNGYFVNIYRLLEWLKKENIKTVLTLHAEFMYTANCGHALDCEKWKSGCGECPQLKESTKSFISDNTAKSWKKMKKAFDGFDNIKIVSVSPWLKDRASIAPILDGKDHIVIYNGLNTDVFRLKNVADVRKKYCGEDELLVFHATANFTDDENDLKGGHYLIQLAELCKNEKIKFVVAGRHNIQGKVPENMILLGNISDQENLAELYSAADVTLLVSKKETFSMIVAESLCCGTAVAGFRAGAPEQIAIPEYSSFVQLGNLELLKEEMISVAVKHKDNKEKIAAKAAEIYSSGKMLEKYMNLYRSVL